MNAGRIVVNTPSSQGALGGTYNMLSPSLTLACGTGGGNITTDNISVKHLLNIQRVARRRIDDCLDCMHKHSLNENVNAILLDETCKSIKENDDKNICAEINL